MTESGAGPTADNKLSGPVFILKLGQEFVTPALAQMPEIERRERVGNDDRQTVALPHFPQRFLCQ